MTLCVPRRPCLFPAVSRWVPKELVWCYTVEKTNESGIEVATSAALAVPAHFAFPALETILNEFSKEPGRASLALNVRQLHLPFEATISAPVEAHVAAGNARNEWRLHILATSNSAMYPTFDGVLTLITAGDSGSQLQLEGHYAVPFGAVGRAIDKTVLSGAARSSLQRFVRELAYRVAAIARWIE